jgi:hypothetical protein
MGWSHRRRWQDEVQERVAHQLSAIRHDVAALGKSVAVRGGHLQHDAGDIGEALWHGGEAMARQLGRQATRASRALREDPMPAVIGVVAIVGVVAALGLAFGRK